MLAALSSVSFSRILAPSAAKRACISQASKEGRNGRFFATNTKSASMGALFDAVFPTPADLPSRATDVKSRAKQPVFDLEDLVLGSEESSKVRNPRTEQVVQRTQPPLGQSQSQSRTTAYSKSEGGDSIVISPEAKGASIDEFALSEHVKGYLRKAGITQLFAVQAACLTPVLEGHDVVVKSKTGTGKTLAFAIPVVEKILKLRATTGSLSPLALIMAPTRELALQVTAEIRKLTHLRIVPIYGGASSYVQRQELSRGVDIVVGTPGRIIDLSQSGALDLSKIRFLVLDEADHMLDIGFADDMETIITKLPSSRQTMLFSATVPQWIQRVRSQYMRNPKTIDMVGTQSQTPHLVAHQVIYVTETNYLEVLQALLTKHSESQTIVFTERKQDVDMLGRSLFKVNKCRPLHGDISQGQREVTLTGFREGRFKVLIATNVAARGLDIPAVDLIVQIGAPVPTTYIHRSGRCGRAGREGTAITLLRKEDSHTISVLEEAIGGRIQVIPAPQATDPESVFAVNPDKPVQSARSGTEVRQTAPSAPTPTVPKVPSSPNVPTTREVDFAAAKLSGAALSDQTIQAFAAKAVELSNQNPHALAKALAYIHQAATTPAPKPRALDDDADAWSSLKFESGNSPLAAGPLSRRGGEGNRRGTGFGGRVQAGRSGGSRGGFGFRR